MPGTRLTYPSLHTIIPITETRCEATKRDETGRNERETETERGSSIRHGASKQSAVFASRVRFTVPYGFIYVPGASSDSALVSFHGDRRILTPIRYWKCKVHAPRKGLRRSFENPPMGDAFHASMTGERHWQAFRIFAPFEGRDSQLWSIAKTGVTTKQLTTRRFTFAIDRSTGDRFLCDRSSMTSGSKLEEDCFRRGYAWGSVRTKG